MTRKVALYIIPFVLLAGVTVAQEKPSPQDFEEKLDQYMTALNKVGEFSGSILVSSNGNVKFHKGYGLASRRFNIANDTTTKFRIASMTKSFTAICILQMVEQGRLSLEESISTYIKFPLGESIKLKHLLSHSSGIKRDIIFQDEAKIYNLEELVSLARVDSLLFLPGTATAYSNCDYILLQAILETVSGIDFETYLTQNVLSPLGLKNTGIEHPFTPPVLMADGFGPGVDRAGNFEIQETKLISFGYSEAVTAMYSTTGDMFKFCSQLGKNSILKPETWKLAFTPVVKETPFYNWGLGFTMLGADGEAVLNHNGRTTGFKGGYFYDPKSDFALIILGNNSEAARSSIVNTVQAILDGKPYYIPKYYETISLDNVLLKQFVGDYQANDFSFTISEFQERLFVKSHGDVPTSISPYGKDSFFCDYFDLKLIFNRKGGMVDSCDWVFQNETIRAKKVNK